VPSAWTSFHNYRIRSLTVQLVAARDDHAPLNPKHRLTALTSPCDRQIGASPGTRYRRMRFVAKQPESARGGRTPHPIDPETMPLVTFGQSFLLITSVRHTDLPADVKRHRSLRDKALRRLTQRAPTRPRDHGPIVERQLSRRYRRDVASRMTIRTRSRLGDMLLAIAGGSQARAQHVGIPLAH
jgi:hypothetical protein